MKYPQPMTCKLGSGGPWFALQIVAVIVFLGVHAWGQDQTPGDLAILQGMVRDSSGHPVPATQVSLQMKSGVEVPSLLTDSTGHYRFSGLREGTYKLRAERAGYGEATADEVALEKQQTRSIDLILRIVDSSGIQKAPASRPEFFDQPSFTVAGVTDPSNLGGHGSDTIVRTKESLAKATASLGREAPDASHVELAGSQTEKSLREAAERDPGSFEANYRLGRLLVDGGRAREALPYLGRALELNPESYESAYEVAVAYAAAGEYEDARASAHTLLTRQETAGLHHLLGEVEEKAGNPLQAVGEYERAAELNPSEANIFDWGAELLIHRAPEPAIEVFTKGNRAFPQSVRMLVGLGSAEYARGFYEQAAQHLCAASDLSPDDPVPYRLIGKIQNVDGPQAEAVHERLGRFARLQPENPEANYYYALNLWRRRKSPQDAEAAQAETLLRRAVRLDSKFSAAYLQLGVIYAERKSFLPAVWAYQKAIETDPRLEEAHYRLAQAYRQMGKAGKARSEVSLYEQIAKENAGKADRERREIKQFVYTLRDQAVPQK